MNTYEKMYAMMNSSSVAQKPSEKKYLVPFIRETF